MRLRVIFFFLKECIESCHKKEAEGSYVRLPCRRYLFCFEKVKGVRRAVKLRVTLRIKTFWCNFIPFSNFSSFLFRKNLEPITFDSQILSHKLPKKYKYGRFWFNKNNFFTFFSAFHNFFFYYYYY